ncbi:MAG: hypothetical protein IJ165_08400 [Proteobacteria bacterium]|nr:hypothetical protein [Pseudomonadota bacterium]
MKMKRNFFALAAMAALSLSLVACDDDSNDTNTPSEPSEPTTTCKATCNGTIPMTCDASGNLVAGTDCAQSGKSCINGACYGSGDQIDPNKPNPNEPTDKVPCTTSGCDSTGTKIITCGADGFVVSTEDCGANGKVCRAGACVNFCQPKARRCAGDTSYKVCNDDGKAWSAVQNCGANEECSGGYCNPKAEVKADSVLGVACSCTGADCSFTITGKEIVTSLGTAPSMIPMISSLIPADLAELKDIDFKGLLDKLNSDSFIITAPNFFSKSNKGCEAVTAPAGMTVGCLRDAKITVTGADELLNAILGIVKGIDPTLIDAELEKYVKDTVASGIEFKSKDGYCLTAAIDIDGQGGMLDTLGITTIKKSDPNSPVNKINTGDHSKAQSAACPAGGQKYSYTTGVESAYANIAVGFDMCLKACANDSDCREGYKCIDIPAEVPEEGETAISRKGCFDPTTIDYFTEMSEGFKD